MYNIFVFTYVCAHLCLLLVNICILKYNFKVSVNIIICILLVYHRSYS